jgi:AcrR family transcriptional regulator
MSKREEKKAKILKAAEVVFARAGFVNANMDHIAKEAGVSKGTVYFYYDSKENLYMAIAHNAVTQLNEVLYNAVHESRTNSGLESMIAIVKAYLNFSENNPLYTEAILDYTALVRGNTQGLDTQRTSRAMQESIFFTKLKDIHNIPLTLVVRQVKRGREDGSILNQSPAVMMYMTAWAMILGYMKIRQTSPPGRDTLFTIPISDWKASIVDIIKAILTSDSVGQV